MLDMSKVAVPDGRFICSDISDVRFGDASFDAVLAIFVLFHLPREEHAEIFRRVYSWLRPGGYFLATLTEFARPPYTKDDFFGMPMYWSCLGWDEYAERLQGVGFAILGGRIIGHSYGLNRKDPDKRNPMVLARKLSDD